MNSNFLMVRATWKTIWCVSSRIIDVETLFWGGMWSKSQVSSLVLICRSIAALESQCWACSAQITFAMIRVFGSPKLISPYNLRKKHLSRPKRCSVSSVTLLMCFFQMQVCRWLTATVFSSMKTSVNGSLDGGRTMSELLLSAWGSITSMLWTISQRRFRRFSCAMRI